MNKVYLMRNSLGLYKIGVSKNVEERRKRIENNSGTFTEIVCEWDNENAYYTEQKLHSYFEKERQAGEWFKITDPVVKINEILKAQPNKVEQASSGETKTGNTLGSIIRKYRAKSNLTQSQLSKDLKRPQSFISDCGGR